ncbi:MAG TPA: type II toxin-antitoxin system death-on-curing family toxin [Candidatus Aphodovivens avistercoris]|nr:type II toxin-antitoxin system death-on-curing family toxin [Candidatus Aphodovivens avistercoris]
MSDGIVLFESADSAVTLDVATDGDTVWLSQAQMVELFGRDKSTISRHVNNVFKEGELERDSTVAFFATVQNEGGRLVERQVEFYNLDVVISVGYRVKSQRGVEFRRWATGVLRRYIIEGAAANERRLAQLGKVAQVMARIPDSLETRQVLDIVSSYTAALDLLDDYDHQRVRVPEGSKATHVLSYGECREVIDGMRFGSESDLFGVEKDESFKGTLGSIYQGFDGQEIYPSLQEKAANLLYLVIKNHAFLDGNKRIAATMFLYFLDRNGALFVNGRKAIDDSTLVAVTVMIAESKPEEKDIMIALVVNFITMGS